MKFIFESDSTINSYEPDYVINYERDIKDESIIRALALDLLTIEEVEELPKTIREYNNWWWLQTPSNNQNNAVTVDPHGLVYYHGNLVSNAYVVIRPALTLSNFGSSNLELYENYTIGNEKWIYIGNNRFLYNDEPDYHRFDRNSNNYESSEIKKYLNDWLKRLQSKEVIIKESYSLHEGIFDSKKDKIAKYQKIIADAFGMKFSEAISYIWHAFDDVLSQCQLYKDSGGNAVNTYHAKKDVNASNLKTHAAAIRSCADKNEPLKTLATKIEAIAAAFGVDYNSIELKIERDVHNKLIVLERDKEGRKALDYITKTVYERLYRSIKGLENVVK